MYFLLFTLIYFILNQREGGELGHLHILVLKLITQNRL